MNEIKIKQVKLIKEGEKVEVTYKESEVIKSSIDRTCEDPVHPDLKNAVHGLAVHLAILTDYIEAKQSKDKDLIEKFVVTGYSIGGKEGEEGVTITGYRKTKSGQTVTLNTPFTRFEQSEESRYILMGDLLSKINDIESEVLEYLFEGKKLQGDLFSEGNKEPVTHIQIAAPETEEEKNEAILKNLREGNSVYANPDAMARIKEMDKEDKARGGKKGGKKNQPAEVEPE